MVERIIEELMTQPRSRFIVQLKGHLEFDANPSQDGFLIPALAQCFRVCTEVYLCCPKTSLVG